MRYAAWLHVAFVLSAALVAPGCNKVEVTQTKMASYGTPAPDHVLVYDFAVKAEDVQLDQGVGPKLARGAGNATQTEEELRVGRMVADALSTELIKELGKNGIVAQRAKGFSGVKTDLTVEVTGRFLRVDEGDRTKRTLVGFGMGGSEVRTIVQGFQGQASNRRLIGEGRTKAKSGLKPGMLLPIGVSAGVGNATGAVVAGAATAGSEALSANVAAIARQTAQQIAEAMRTDWVRLGWLAPQKVK